MSERKLTAAEGMALTNGEVFGKEIYLGCNDSPENWWEIPEAEVPVDDGPATEEDYEAALGRFGVRV